MKNDPSLKINPPRSARARPDRLPDFSISERTYRRIALGILFMALVIRLMGLGKGIWLDEYHSLEFALSQNFLQKIRLDTHPPLYYFLLKLWSKVSLREEFLRLLSVAFGIGTVAVIIKWMKQYSTLGSLLSGLYCATLPMMLRYSQEIRGYPLLLLVTALSFYFASRLISEPEKLSNYVGLGFSLSIAVATKLIGVMLIPSICLYIAIGCPIWRTAQLKKTILTLTVPLSLFFLTYFFFLKQLPKEPDSWYMPAVSGNLLISTAEKMLGVRQALSPLRVARNYLPALAGGITPLIIISVLGLVAGLLIFGNWRRSLTLLAPALLYWAQLIIYSILVIPIFWYKTVLPGLIPFIGFVGLQISTVRIRRLKFILVIGLTLLSTVHATYWISNEAWRPYEHWRGISRSLKPILQPNDIVIFFPGGGKGPVSFYIELPSRAALPIPTKANMKEVEREISERVAERKNLAEPFAVILITRFSINVEKNIEKYHRLLTYLETKYGKPSFSKKLGNLSLMRYEVHKPGI